MPDGGRRDLVLVATMANRVFAFDANTGAQVWSHTLGTPVKGNQGIDEHQINDHWGILSTPVIDVGTGIMYLCAWISDNGSVANARHSLHALRITIGQDAHPAPIDFEGAPYNPGHGPARAGLRIGRPQTARLAAVRERNGIRRLRLAARNRRGGTGLDYRLRRAKLVDCRGLGYDGKGLRWRHLAGRFGPGLGRAGAYRLH